MRSRWKTTISCLPLVLGWLACSRDVVHPSAGFFQFRMEHYVSEEPLDLDHHTYTNSKGNSYKVSKVEYLISDPWFITEKGEEYRMDTTYYVNAEENTAFKVGPLPTEKFLKMGFMVGVPVERNVTGGLPNTKEFLEMAWPAQMGGGYHFLRFEGHFKDTSGWTGFAFHLGKDTNQIELGFEKQLVLNTIKHPLEIRMDLDEWFRNPYPYDLTRDPNYTMSNDSAMNVLSANGGSVFTIRDMK